MGSPTLTAVPAVDVTLSLFGGTDTEISPSDVPEGLSPDNQDMIFLPGDTSNRPGLHKLFNTPFPGNVSVMYQKTYVQPNNEPLTLILTSDGKLWVEDVTNSPGTYTQIGSVPAGLYAQSISAFGREYIAFSDLLHGQSVPLQFDGTNLDRVTQDGPGAPPLLADENNVFAIAPGPGGAIQISAPIVAAPLGLVQVGTVVTVKTTTSPFAYAAGGFQNGALAGDQIQISGAGVAGYNAIWQLSNVIDQNTAQFIAPAGLGNSGGGTLDTQIVAFGPVDTSALAIAKVGEPIIVAGVGTGGYNGTWIVRGFGTIQIYAAINVFALAASGGGTLTMGGNISVGTHGCCVSFLTRSGSITAPSPIRQWSAAGGKRVVVSNIPRGPSNVMARILSFTGAGGDNFFFIPATVSTPSPSGGPPTITYSTVVPDNTSTSFIVDFSDNTLFAAIPIDVIGNDLFDQVVLGTVMGFFAYASRLATWGDWTKVENFLNMGFCGGYISGVLSQPLGWTVETSGGTLVNGGSWAGGMAWQIQGDLSSNPRGRISQTAYQDSFGDAILSPDTPYLIRFWGKVSLANLAGNIFIELLDSATGIVFASATIPCASLSPSGGFVEAVFNAPTPATIPPGALFRVYTIGQPNGSFVTLSELEPIFQVNPFRNTLARFSYVLNPEAFAQTTGNLGAADDESPIQNFSLQRNVGLLHTGEATHEFKDNNFEPGDGDNGWSVDSLTHSVGALSLRACDPGKFGTGDSAEDWDIIASKNGVYLHLGSNFYKVGQEMSRTLGTAPNAITWDDINWAAQQTVWVKNVVNKRYALIGVPIGESILPNVIFVMDYREMDTASQIAAAMPIHNNLAGKMKSSDMARKWTRWNIAANCAEILVRPGNEKEVFLGGGPTAGHGQAFGNLYWLDPAKLTDDDYGRMFPYYFTYFFVDHDQEQQLQLGSARHLYKHISGFITGVGYVTITPYVNSLQNVLPSGSPRLLASDSSEVTAQANDLEWTTGIKGQRVSFKITVDPIPGTTDVQIKLQKLIVRMMKDPVSLFRSSGL